MRKLLFSMVAVLLFGGQMMAQVRTVSGRVLDDLGSPIFGASVTVKGSQGGTTTGEDGSFSISVPTSARFLIFSAVGLQTQEIEITGSELSITLSEQASELDEVVVVPYGTARRRTFTGAVSTLGGNDVARQQISNVSRSLEGAVSGVQVTTGSGQPGDGSAIRIRGIGSINASSAPLYVVDGVPFGGDINSINPNDVESISVLKDAASTALYGARGGNGVIMITTRRGKGKPRVDINARYGVNSRAIPEYDVIRETGLFAELYWEALRNEAIGRTTNPLSPAAAGGYATRNLVSKWGGYNPFTVGNFEIVDSTTGRLNPNTGIRYYDDWADAMFASRPRQEYTATVSGSSDKTRYMFSLGMLDDQGYIVQSSFKRFTGRLNLDQQVSKWLRVGINGSYANSRQGQTQEGNTTYQNAFYFTRRVAPVYPVYLRDASGGFVLDDEGQRLYDFGDGVMGSRLFAGTENPRATLDLDIYNRIADNVSARGYAEVSFLPELKLTLNYGVDVLSSNNTSFQNPTFGNAIGANGRGTVSSARNTTSNINQLLNYTKSFGDHNLDVLLGHESYEFITSSLTATKENFLDPRNPNLGNAVSIQNAFSGQDEHSIEGYFSQVRYDYQGKYLLSASFRRDASSRFLAENRWGTFYSIGGGYVISEEKFLQNSNVINYLKLKASYGVSGNEGLLKPDGTQSYYAYADQFQVVNNNGALGLVFDYKGNPAITWEKNRQIDFGVDFRLFNRLNGTLEFFRRTTYDLLFNIPLPVSTGVANYPSNVGDMYNQGVEFELNADVVRSKDFRFNIGVNGTHVKNKIIRLPEENRENGIITGNFKYMEGRSLYDYFTWQYAGVNAATGQSLWFMDEMVNNEPTGMKETTPEFNQATRDYIGKNALPVLRGGVNLSLTYKGFDLNVLTAYGIGGYVYDAPYQALMYAGGGDVTTWHRDILQRWTPENPNTNVPKLMENYQNANAASDRWLIDGSYFSLRNIMLGYNLPDGTLERFGITNSRFYVVADNVFLTSRRQGLDPRQGFAGEVLNAYAPIRTVSAGVNLTF